MKRNGIIAAAAVLALGTVAMATDASAQSRHRGMGASLDVIFGSHRYSPRALASS